MKKNTVNARTLSESIDLEVLSDQHGVFEYGPVSAIEQKAATTGDNSLYKSRSNHELNGYVTAMQNIEIIYCWRSILDWFSGC